MVGKSGEQRSKNKRDETYNFEELFNSLFENQNQDLRSGEPNCRGDSSSASNGDELEETYLQAISLTYKIAQELLEEYSEKLKDPFQNSTEFMEEYCAGTEDPETVEALYDLRTTVRKNQLDQYQEAMVSVLDQAGEFLEEYQQYKKEDMELKKEYSKNFERGI